MTQEEYLSMTDEAKSALFATDVLEFERSSIETDYLDPINNLDHAFMGVDKFLAKYNFILRHVPMREVGDVWEAYLGGKMNGISKNLNEAIMLACLKAKGVVE